MQKKIIRTPDDRISKERQTDLGAAYQQMAQDEAREADALEWVEATAGDVVHEA